MGRIKNLKYTISVPMPGAAMKKKSGGKVVGAAANALNSGVNGLFNCGVKNELKQKLEEMYPAIYDAMKDHTGVLVVVQFQQWKSQNAAGNNPPQLLSVIIGPAASNRQSAFRKHKMRERMPAIKQSPGAGMVYGPSEFLWFTRDLSKAELQQRLNETQEKEQWKPAR